MGYARMERHVYPVHRIVVRVYTAETDHVMAMKHVHPVQKTAVPAPLRHQVHDHVQSERLGALENALLFHQIHPIVEDVALAVQAARYAQMECSNAQLDQHYVAMNA